MTLYTDYDPWCCARLMSRVQTGDLPDGDVMLADVRELTEEHLAKYRHIHLFAGIGGIPLGLAWAGWPAEWSIITGGFPCPDISTAGKRAGLAGKRSGLFFDMLRICEAVRPDWILAENVGGLASCGLDTVAGSLEQAGYHVWPLRVGAWSLGAPHERERWWVVCGRRGVLADADVRRYDGWAREPWRAPLGRTASGQVRAYSPTPVAKDADSMSGPSHHASLKRNVVRSPTPTAHDARRPGLDMKSTEGANLSRSIGRSLTPTAEDAEQTGDNPDRGPTLTSQVRRSSTPVAQDAKNITRPPSAGTWDTLPGDLIRLSNADGPSPSSPDSLNANGSSRGSISADWDAQYMGYPDGWLGLTTEAASWLAATLSCPKSSLPSRGG